MLAVIEFTAWQWSGFVACILLFLLVDLGVFHRVARVVRFKEALAWSAVWFSLSMCFAGALLSVKGRTAAIEFITGYVIELSLSMDNVFVIAAIFSYFSVPAQYKHRVLFWGILGALVMRGVMIAAGAALVEKFIGLLYFFGAFLLFTGLKILFSNGKPPNPENSLIVGLAQKILPVTSDLHGQRFFIRRKGRWLLTLLGLVLITVELTDLIFALDSLPAIFGITTNKFIIFTSNAFAILGLRSLYFVLAESMKYFRFLQAGISVVLVFIGVKMLLDPHGHSASWFQFKIDSGASLLIVAIILGGSIILSFLPQKTGPNQSPSIE